jgi:hypothetical protein
MSLSSIMLYCFQANATDLKGEHRHRACHTCNRELQYTHGPDCFVTLEKMSRRTAGDSKGVRRGERRRCRCNGWLGIVDVKNEGARRCVGVVFDRVGL